MFPDTMTSMEELSFPDLLKLGLAIGLALADQIQAEMTVPVLSQELARHCTFCAHSSDVV